MKHVVIAGVLAGVVGLGSAVPRAQDRPLLSRSVAVQSTTLEGCLRQGAKDGEFSFAAGGDEYTVVPSSGLNLAAHLNHQVQVTGTVEKKVPTSVLRASAVKMVAASCTAS